MPPPPDGSGTMSGAWSSPSEPKNITLKGGAFGGPQASDRTISAAAAGRRPRHAEEAGRLPSQSIGRERRSRLAIQVHPQGVAKLEPAPGRPAGELNAPRACDAVNGQQ